MSLLDNLENNLVVLLKSLMKEEDFVKLISIDNPNALSQSSSTTFFDLINERLFLRPRINLPTSEEETYLCIYLSRGNRAGRNDTIHNNIYIVVDIMCHLNLWDLENNKIRPYRITDIVFERFMQSNIKGVRGNLVLDGNFELMRFNEKFMGYRMFFKYTSSVGF